MYTLYGDGIHDDHPAIQERIDSGVCEVVLPVPKVKYVISQPLRLPSNFRLVLPRYAEICLADSANCVMVQNKVVRKPASEDGAGSPLWFYTKVWSAAPEDAACNIEIIGGIWNCNNMGQNPNPIQTRCFEPEGYTGFGMIFFNVSGLKLSSLTLKDPVNFGVTLDRVSYFTVEDITFDYNYGNPKPLNMDGIHINGNCHHGQIRNLRGACYDDLVALNADEGSGGPISHMEISHIFSEDCHSAVRMLTVRHSVEYIHISQVHGTYYQYCIGLTKYYPGETVGHFDAIVLENIYASKAERREIYCKGNSRVYPLIWVQGNCRVGCLHIRNLQRRERQVEIETVHIGKNTVVKRLVLEDIVTKHEKETGENMPLLVNLGSVERLITRDLEENM